LDKIYILNSILHIYITGDPINYSKSTINPICLVQVVQKVENFEPIKINQFKIHFLPYVK